MCCGDGWGIRVTITDFFLLYRYSTYTTSCRLPLLAYPHAAAAAAAAFVLYRWKLHLPKDYFVTGPPPPPGEFVVSPLDPSSERGPCAPPRGPFLKICFFRYTRLHTSRVRALETASFTLEGAAATCEETAMDETMVVLLTHGARQVERALRRALHCPQQHSKLPAPHLLALVP